MSFASPVAEASVPRAREHRRVGDVSAKWAVPVLAGLATLTFAGVLYLTSYKNFYYDEWDFVSTFRPSQSTSILFPHVEHWSTVPILLWKLLFILFGLRTHLPYEAAALMGHVACVALLFVLVRRWAGDLPALAVALILLVLGSGATDIVWAFQVAWTISIGLGLTAMLLVETSPQRMSLRRKAIVSALLLVSVMSSGVGLGFVATVTIQLVANRARWRDWYIVAPPAIAYLAWFVVYGAGLAGTPGSNCTTCYNGIPVDLQSMGVGSLRDLAAFVAQGLISTAGAALGQTGILERISALGIAALLTWHWTTDRRVRPWELALIAGLLTQLVLIGLVRVRFGIGRSSDPHYLYVWVLFLLPLLAFAVRTLPLRGVSGVLLGAVLAAALVSNAAQLAQQSVAQADLMRTENAELRVVELFRGAPSMNMDVQLDSDIMPQLTPRIYYAASDELGSAVPDSTPRSLQQLPAAAVDHEMNVLFGDALIATTAADQAAPQAGCQTAGSNSGAVIDFQIPDGQTFLVRAGSDSDAYLSIGVVAPRSSEPTRRVHLPAATLMQFQTPDTGHAVNWRVRITTLSASSLLLCGSAVSQFHQGSTVLSAPAAGGAFDPGWKTAADPTADSSHVAVLPIGTATSTSINNSFGGSTTLPQGAYDIWFRARVSNQGGSRPEMFMGLWDIDAGHWAGVTQLAPNEVGTSYAWVRVAQNVTVEPNHHLTFIAALANDTAPSSTDWYIDQAAIQLSGAPPPA